MLVAEDSTDEVSAEQWPKATQPYQYHKYLFKKSVSTMIYGEFIYNIYSCTS